MADKVDFSEMLREWRENLRRVLDGDDPILTHGVNGTVYERAARHG